MLYPAELRARAVRACGPFGRRDDTQRAEGVNVSPKGHPTNRAVQAVTFATENTAKNAQLGSDRDRDVCRAAADLSKNNLKYS